MNFTTALAVMLVSCLLALSNLCAEPLPTDQANIPDAAQSDTTVSQYVEISISRNLLTLYEKKGAEDMAPVAEYASGFSSETRQHC